ncbi:MAG: PQQ-binding-like beta-propeller repeat protein [Acidobacteriota bacterium]|nr:PQQ-binding-like beta-propeller repeat protein [Acidobacteriota bacterium]
MRARRRTLFGVVLLTTFLVVFGCRAATPSKENTVFSPLERVLKPRTVLVLGEIHGTVEAPAMVSRIAAWALDRGQSVTVALEIPREEEALVTGFLASAGTLVDRQAFLAGPFWQSGYQDGRASEAMATLLQDLQRLMASGEPLRVVLIDQRGARGEDREQAMADALAAAVSSAPEGFTISLVGNLHAQLARGAGHGVDEPMALRIAELLPNSRVIALEVASSGGTAWVCGGHRTSGCGLSALGGGEIHRTERVSLDVQLVGGFHGSLSVGTIHASPPAVEIHRTPEAMTIATWIDTTHTTAPAAPTLSAGTLQNPVSKVNPAGDWPQWMGPHRTGAATVSGVFPRGKQIELGVSWRTGIGGGFSSVSIVGGTAYTLAEESEEEWLLALDVHDGSENWRTRLDAAGHDTPASTPAVVQGSNGAVFALNPRGKLHAIATDGSPLWSRDLQESLGAVPHSYGMSTSPLIVDDLVTVLVGGQDKHNLVAFHKTSGEIEWSVAHAKWGSYASPTLLTIAGERQIVAPADDRLYAVRPDDGSLLWSIDSLGEMDRIPLPLPRGRLFLAQEAGAVMLRVNREDVKWQVEEVWRSDSLQHSYSPAVHLDGAIYGFDGPFLTSIDAATGEMHWRHKTGDATLILVDRHLVVLGTMSGLLRIVEARPDRFEERATIQVLTGGEGYAAPSYAGGRIFVRNKQEIAAVEIGSR